MTRRNCTTNAPSILRQYQQILLSAGSLLLGLFVVFVAAAFIQKDDASVKQPERVFRVCKWITAPDGTKTPSVKSSGLLSPAVNQHLSKAIECSGRYMQWPDEVEMTNFNQLAPTKSWAFADPVILEMFDIKIVSGAVENALKQPGHVILSERYAKKLFGNADPVGQSVMGLGGKIYTVSAIAQTPDSHSAIQFDALASWASTEPDAGLHSFPFLNNWTAHLAETFVRLEDVRQSDDAQEAIAQLTQRLPHPSGSTDLFLKSLSGTTAKTGAVENAEQDRFGARASAPGHRMVLMAKKFMM